MGPPKFPRLLRLVPRITQILFCIICLATAAATVKTFGQATPGAVGLALFAASAGLLVSTLLLLTDLLNNVRLTRVFKGLLDFILSILLAIFLLSAGAAIAGFGSCGTTSSGYPYILQSATGPGVSSSLLVPADIIGSSGSSNTSNPSITSASIGSSSNSSSSIGSGGSNSTTSKPSTATTNIGSSSSTSRNGSSSGSVISTVSNSNTVSKSNPVRTTTSSSTGLSGISSSSRASSGSIDSSGNSGSSTSSTRSPGSGGLSSSLYPSYNWNNYAIPGWSNSGLTGAISDTVNSQFDHSMSAIDQLGHRRLLGFNQIVPRCVGNSLRRQLLQSADYKLVCPAWNAVPAMSFILFVLYSISAVLAVLDMRAGKGLYVPVWLHKPAAVRAADNQPIKNSGINLEKPTAAATAAALVAKDVSSGTSISPAVVVSCERAVATQQFETGAQDAAEHHIATTELHIDGLGDKAVERR